MDAKILEAFKMGSPTKAWELVNQLSSVAKQATLEAGKARFEANFGTSRCDTCEGLKAGPGVVATCFQRKSCFFTNFREESISVRQQRVIDRLTKSGKR